MPNDYLTLHCLEQELNHLLSGGKIDKIYQPERDELTFAVRSKGERYILSMSASAQNPRIHLTNIKKDNPSTAPALCMHLRKLLLSGYIESIALANSDRIFDITIRATNELNDKVKFHLMFEMMGRYSNVIVINDKNTILDAIKILPYDGATKRCLLLGARYEFPEQGKILPTNYDAIASYLNAYSGGNITKYFLSGVSGLSPISADELFAKYADQGNLSSDDVTIIVARLKSLYELYGSELFSPCCYIDDSGAAKDYFIYRYDTVSHLIDKDRLSDAIEMCLLTKDTSERQREKTKHLSSAIKKYRSRQQKKLEKGYEKLEECTKIDTFKKYGELITCNLHLIKKGDKELKVIDYYDENMLEITIPLNPLMHPTGCSQEYFKRYNKLKRTLAIITTQIVETESAIKYSHSIDSGIANCATQAELIQLEEELLSIGAIKRASSLKIRGVKPSEPHYYEVDNYSIMVGKNNIQNDKLTFKVANGNDMWIHALGYHGSHVIIFAEGRVVPDNVITIGCQLAAFYSQGSVNDKVAVDYTQRRNVKRDCSGNLGMVNYSGQSTAYVAPCKHENLLVTN